MLLFGFCLSRMSFEEFSAILQINGKTIKTPCQKDDVLKNTDYDRFLEKHTMPVPHHSIGNLCSICMEEFTSTDKVCRIVCKHHMHAECLWDWVRTQADQCKVSHCPICNEVLFAPVMRVEKNGETTINYENTPKNCSVST